MKLVKIRYNGSKLTTDRLSELGDTLVRTLRDVGFITESYVINGSRIDLKLHMKSFIVDVEKLGYNASLNPHMNYKNGYRRTSIPTWDQRVEYNNIVNKVLDSYGIDCNIQSLHFTIRRGTTSYDESDWENQRNHNDYERIAQGFNTVAMSEIEYKNTMLGKALSNEAE